MLRNIFFVLIIISLASIVSSAGYGYNNPLLPSIEPPSIKNICDCTPVQNVSFSNNSNYSLFSNYSEYAGISLDNFWLNGSQFTTLSDFATFRNIFVDYNNLEEYLIAQNGDIRYVTYVFGSNNNLTQNDTIGEYFGESGCDSSNNWCSGTDLGQSGNVNLLDLNSLLIRGNKIGLGASNTPRFYVNHFFGYQNTMNDPFEVVLGALLNISGWKKVAVGYNMSKIEFNQTGNYIYGDIYNDVNITEDLYVQNMPVTRTMWVSNASIPIYNVSNSEQSSLRLDSGKGSFTIPANFCKSGRTISIESMGDYVSSTTLVGSELAHYLYVNETQVFFSNLTIISTGGNIKSRMFDWKITCLDDASIGIGNILISSNVWSMQSTSTAIQNQFNNINQRVFTINMSNPQTLNITHRWRANSMPDVGLNITSTIIRVDG